jgi:ferrous iron transport protein B
MTAARFGHTLEPIIRPLGYDWKMGVGLVAAFGAREVFVSPLIWFVPAMQCMSTVAIVKRETNGWGWPIFMTVYMNGLAYVLCLIVFQVGAHVFHL